MIPVQVVDIWRKEDMPLMQIVLYDEAGQRAMLIWVGEAEGFAILQGLLCVEMPRPMTPAFIARLLKAADATVESILISALKNDIFYATVRLRAGGQSHEVDARPSDALALAMQVGAPIYVSPEVMKTAGRVIPAGHVPTKHGMTLAEAYLKSKQVGFDRAAREAILPPAEEKQQAIAKEEEAILSGAFGKQA